MFKVLGEDEARYGAPAEGLNTLTCTALQDLHAELCAPAWRMQL